MVESIIIGATDQDLKQQTNVHFSTCPPSIERTFKTVIEMAGWIDVQNRNKAEDGQAMEEHAAILHQPDLHTSNTTFILACLVAFLHRRGIFRDTGSQGALRFIQKLASNYSYTRMSAS